jgi:diguanylate cyclase (GGDEF)-like protein/putative nucleotidyltransferase with HDIG domain
MRSLPVSAQVYIVAVIAAGAAIAAWALPSVHVQNWLLFAALLVLSNITSAFKVALLSASGSTLSVSYTIDFASLLLLGPAPTILIAITSAWSQCTFRMKQPTPWYRTLFSMASLAITVRAAGWAYEYLGGVPGTFANSFTVAAALVGAATTYFLFNTVLVSCAIALSTRQSPITSWNQNFLWSAPSYFVGAAVAFITGWAVLNLGLWMGLLLIAAPVYFIYRTYKIYLGRIEDERRHVQEMSDLHLATIEALALAIDAKDQTAQSHIRRVQVYAAGLAKALGMSEQEIQGVKTAALLHDIGKLAVPEHILSKPGPLTQEEFQKIRIHPQVGAEIISAVPFPYPVAPLILSHHERWDGRGYPQGLRGEDIPLGARILTVVDYFDALTSDRPYHRAMDHDAALALLGQEAGKALDPAIVSLFVQQLPLLAAEADRLENAPARRLTLEPTSELGRPAVGFESETGARTNTVFDDIALAHKEIYALYEIAQSMGTSLGVADTMALISKKLSNLVPFATCALFLYDEDQDVLRCRFATGVDSEILGGMVVKSGQGLTGWVTRNRRPLVNARPTADFEAAGLGGTPTALKSAIVSPLVFSERLIGVLAVYQESEDAYTDDHRRLIDRVCEQAGAVINNASLFERTEKDSLTDALTGLPNTRSMFTHLTRELSRAERLKSEVALLVMDCDDFKEINDTHGHHVGDRALREVASVLKAGVRPYDLCVRYAGDEFIVVLSGCGADEAERKRLELKKAMADVTFEARPGKRVPLSISVGAAVYPHDGETYEALLAAGDARMYRDKTSRRGSGRSTSRAADRLGSGVRLPVLPPDVTETEIERARAGVL